MSHQPEAILEEHLVNQLGTLGYAQIRIHDENSILANLKSHNPETQQCHHQEAL